MKKIFASVVAVILFCVSVAFFAACEKVQPNTPSDDEVTITAELSESEVAVGETVTVSYSASKGSVSVTYSKDGGASVTFTGTTFTPEEAGVYVFTFSAENADSVTKTLTVTAPEPVKPVITAELDKTEITAGESVTITYSATENAVVTVTYTKDGQAASGLAIESGKPVTISEAGVYVFTFSAENADSVTKTLTVTAPEPVKPVITAEMNKTEIKAGESVTITYSATANAVVTVTYTKDGQTASGLAIENGKPVTIGEAGVYVFTFSAENADSVTKTLTVTAPEPVKPVITAEMNKTEIKAGESVTITYSATENAVVTVTYTKDGQAASGLAIESGKPVTISEAGVYVFTFSAENADSVTKTLTVTENVTYELGLTADGYPLENGGTIELCVGTKVSYEATITAGGVIGMAYYTVNDGEPQYLTQMRGELTFDTVGKYKIKISAENASDFDYTVIVKEHSYSGPVLDSANGQVKFTCANCQDVKVSAITGLTATAQGSAYAVIKEDGIELHGITLEVSYGAVAGTGIQAGEMEISLDDPYLNVADYEAGKPGKVQFVLGSIQSTLDDVTVYETVKEGVSQTEMAAYLPDNVAVKTVTGEFEVRFSLTDVTPISTTPDTWDSWLMQFTAGNGAKTVLRADDYILDNFGRGNGTISLGEAAECTLEGTMPASGDISFVIARTYANGKYTITVTISGDTTATVTMQEPVSNGNTMSFAFGGEECRYGYSDILGVEKTLAVSSITAEAIEVSLGTSLADAVKAVAVTVSYEGSQIKDTLKGDACEYSSNDYQADKPQTYAVTLTYQGKSTTMNVTVKDAAYMMLKSYSVQGEEFTDGTTAIGTSANGTFANGGFKANAADTVMAANPYLGKNITTGITISISLYVNASVQWAPVLGFKSNTLSNDIGAFMCLVTGAESFQLSYNGWNDSYADVSSGVVLAQGVHEIVLQMEVSGAVKLYIDDTLYELKGGEAAYSNALTAFLPSCETVRFFGGGFKDAGGAWNGVFDGYIQNCSFYNGIVPVEDLA